MLHTALTSSLHSQIPLPNTPNKRRQVPILQLSIPATLSIKKPGMYMLPILDCLSCSTMCTTGLTRCGPLYNSVTETGTKLRAVRCGIELWMAAWQPAGCSVLAAGWQWLEFDINPGHTTGLSFIIVSVIFGPQYRVSCCVSHNRILTEKWKLHTFFTNDN